MSPLSNLSTCGPAEVFSRYPLGGGGGGGKITVFLSRDSDIYVINGPKLISVFKGSVPYELVVMFAISVSYL